MCVKEGVNEERKRGRRREKLLREASNKPRERESGIERERKRERERVMCELSE